mgnify:CR=1 FL=1
MTCPGADIICVLLSSINSSISAIEIDDALLVNLNGNKDLELVLPLEIASNKQQLRQLYSIIAANMAQTKEIIVNKINI